MVKLKLIKGLQYPSTYWNTGYEQQAELQSRTSFVLYARTEQLANGNWNWKGGTAPDRTRPDRNCCCTKLNGRAFREL